MYFDLQQLIQMFCVGSHHCSTILAYMFTLVSYGFKCMGRSNVFVNNTNSIEMAFVRYDQP